MLTRFVLGRTVRLGAMAAAVLAVSCGGDSGGGGTAAAPVIPLQPTMVQITAANQDAVARATVATFFTMGSVGVLPTAAPAPAKAMADTVSAVPIYVLGKAVAPVQGSSNRASRLAVVSQTEACPGGGSMTTTFDDRDNNAGLSAGDAMTFAFNQCRDDVSTMLNGTLAMGIASVTQSATATQLSGAFTFQQLVVVDGSYTSSMNGVMNTTYTETSSPTGTTIRLDATVTPGGFVAQGSTPTVNDTFTYDGGFVAVAIEFIPISSATVGWSTTTLNGTVLVASLGGRLTLVTDPTTAVHQTSTALHPDTGQVLVQGNASRLRLTVMITDSVRSDLDANNDGTYESTKELTWAQLLP
jgi:hypothetical protein